MLQPGLMMDRPLLVSGIIEHAAAQFGDVEIVSRETHGPLFRYTYAMRARARKLAHALAGLGLTRGQRGRLDRLEQPPPHGGLLRGVGQRHGDAHLQPAPAPAAADLHHQPCRRRR